MPLFGFHELPEQRKRPKPDVNYITVPLTDVYPNFCSGI